MSIRQVVVASTEDMESTITTYLNKGYVIGNRTAKKVSLQKEKKFSVMWAVIGFLFCGLPLIIYLIYYATQPDVQVVELVLS